MRIGASSVAIRRAFDIFVELQSTASHDSDAMLSSTMGLDSSNSQTSHPPMYNERVQALKGSVENLVTFSWTASVSRGRIPPRPLVAVSHPASDARFYSASGNCAFTTIHTQKKLRRLNLHNILYYSRVDVPPVWCVRGWRSGKNVFFHECRPWTPQILNDSVLQFAKKEA